MSGTIYFLTNKAMPGLVKIGYTEATLHERLLQLNSTGVPAPFDVFASFMVNDAPLTESEVHKKLQEYRYSVNREFFQICPKKALEIVFPILMGYIPSNTEVSAKNDIQPTQSHDLDEKTLSILQILAGRYRNHGHFVGTLADSIAESEIEIEYRLSTLKELGLVEEKKKRDEWQGNVWKITNKGVKFIFDNNLVEDYMKRKDGF